MQKQYIYYLVLFLLIVYLFSLPSYISYLPTIPVYPDNVEDADKTLLATRSCTDEEKAFFYLTNKSVASAFKPYVNESIQELEDIFCLDQSQEDKQANPEFFYHRKRSCTRLLQPYPRTYTEINRR